MVFEKVASQLLENIEIQQKKYPVISMNSSHNNFSYKILVDNCQQGQQENYLIIHNEVYTKVDCREQCCGSGSFFHRSRSGMCLKYRPDIERKTMVSP